MTTLPTTSIFPANGYIRRFHLAQALDVHVTNIDRWVKAKHLPSPVKLGEKSTAFDAAEINASALLKYF